MTQFGNFWIHPHSYWTG